MVVGSKHVFYPQRPGLEGADQDGPVGSQGGELPATKAGSVCSCMPPFVRSLARRSIYHAESMQTKRKLTEREDSMNRDSFIPPGHIFIDPPGLRPIPNMETSSGFVAGVGGDIWRHGLVLLSACSHHIAMLCNHTWCDAVIAPNLL